MASNKLNAKFCVTASTGTHFDGGGLYLWVKEDGKKYWRMACYLNGKRKLLAFGRYPKVSLDKARKACIAARELLDQGIDPVQHEKDKKLEQVKVAQEEAHEKGSTFEQIARRLIAKKLEAKKATAEYCQKMLRLFEIHLFPQIGHKNIGEIKGAELLALFSEVAQKTNHGRPMTYLAKTLCQRSAEVFDFAYVENNDFTSNPCRVIGKHLPSHDIEHMARISFEDLPKFLQTLKDYQGHVLTKAAIWMLLYTGMRQASVRRAIWKDFDLEKAIWNRQPEKTDKSIHPLPLPKQALELLNDIKAYTGHRLQDLTFPSVRNQHHPMSEAAVTQAIERMGYKMVGHGLRAVVSTGLNELGFKPHVIEIQLGHKKMTKVEASYNKATYFPERCDMMQKWADYLHGLVAEESNSSNPGANLVGVNSTT